MSRRITRKYCGDRVRGKTLTVFGSHKGRRSGNIMRGYAVVSDGGRQRRPSFCVAVQAAGLDGVSD